MEATDKQINVLLVDDRPENLLALEALLEDPKLNLVRATSGPEALKRLLEMEVALILLDVQMPGMDGFETAALIRARPRNQHTPIIFLTAINRNEGYVAKGYEAGGVEFLIKPLVPEVLRAKVNTFVGMYQRQESTQRHVLSLQEALRQSEEQFLQLQKMEAVGMLAGGVAHDFNNLVTTILGYSELLLTRLPENDPLCRIALEIKRAGERAAGLTHQLLAFSRKQAVRPQPVDLNTIVENMETMLRRLIGEHIQLSQERSPQLPPVQADPGQMEQVLLNLVINARDAMAKGGHLSIETATCELDEGYTQRHVGVKPSVYVRLAVSDSGHGMDAQTQQRIFEPFFTTKAPGQGTGLGLSTVYGIITQAGGHIAVYSEPGQGTVVKVYLPCADQTAAGREPAAPVKAAANGSETILLAEDDQWVRDLVYEALQAYGYIVLTAEDGRVATQLSQEFEGPIHLLLTDVVMPHVNGPELAQRLLAERPTLKVLYMSGYTDNAIVHHGVLTAGTSFLQKPFTPDTLARKVREVLASGQ